MQSPTRVNKNLPPKPNFVRSPRSPSLLSKQGRQVLLKLMDEGEVRESSVDDSRGSSEVQTNNRQHGLDSFKNESNKTIESGFAGFGAPHPKLNNNTKQNSLRSVEPLKQISQLAMVQIQTPKDDTLLKGAERLIQNILQNQSLTINSDTILMAMQHNATLQAKKRYSSLLEKPWRTSVNPLADHNECSESSTLNEHMAQIEVKNPKSFRRSISSDGPTGRFIPNQPMISHAIPKQGKSKATCAQQSYLHEMAVSPSRIAGNIIPTVTSAPDSNELEQSKKALNEANQQIFSLRLALEAYEEIAKRKPSATPIDNGDIVDINDESLSSTNIDDDDEIVLHSVASLGIDVCHDSVGPPLNYVRAASPDHRLKNHTTSDNVVSRLEYRALQIRNEQLIHTIKLYEEQLDQIESMANDEDFDNVNRTTNNLGVSTMSNEQEKEIMVSIVSRLNVADNEYSRQLKYMESKIAALVQQLNYSETRCKSLAEKEFSSKSTIDELSQKLMGSELKAKEFNENLMIQTEHRIDDANKAVQKMEQESKAAKEDAAKATIARLSAEDKYLQLEHTNETLVASFRIELNQSKAKSRRLEDEVNKLMATSLEMIELKTDMQSLERKLQQSESLVSELKVNEPLKIAAAVEDVQRRADSRIVMLKKSLSTAKSEHEAAIRRLANLESAETKEQEILREDLRDSETTIACLMEEIEALKPLMEEKTATEQLLNDQQDELELKEMEIAESKAALAQSEYEVEELRNELQMLTSLPDIVRNMQKELTEAKSKLANQKLIRGESKRRLDSSFRDVNEKKQFELQLNEAENLSSAKELESSKCSELQHQLNELNEAYNLAEDEIVELKNQIDSLRPLASDLDNAERELLLTCEKLDLTEREMIALSNELDLLKPLMSDIDEAEKELSDTRFQLTERNRELELCQIKATELQSLINSTDASSDNAAKLLEQLLFAEKQVSELKRELDTAERKVSDADIDRQSENVNLSEKLRLTEERLTLLQTQLQSVEEADLADQLLSQIREEIVLKDNEIISLKNTISEISEELSNCRSMESKVQSDLSKKEKTIMELTPLVNDLRSEIQNTASRSTQITLQYATLIPERDILRKRVAETTSKIDILEKEISQKNALIQDLTMRQDEKEILESLQLEHDRTVERCSDLSLQLAESQFTIGQLTEQIRETQRTALRESQSNANRTSSAVGTSSTTGMDSFRPPKAFKSMLNNGIDRISSRLDDSLRGNTNLMASSSRNMQ